jgi:hypothetical protein
VYDNAPKQTQKLQSSKKRQQCPTHASPINIMQYVPKTKNTVDKVQKKKEKKKEK